MVVVYGYNLTDDIALVTTVDSAKYMGYLYYKDISIQYEELNLGKIKKDKRNVEYLINNSMNKLERGLVSDVNFMLIGKGIRERLFSWIKDTMTEEIEREKDRARKFKKMRKEQRNHENNL